MDSKEFNWPQIAHRFRFHRGQFYFVQSKKHQHDVDGESSIDFKSTNMNMNI